MTEGLEPGARGAEGGTGLSRPDHQVARAAAGSFAPNLRPMGSHPVLLG